MALHAQLRHQLDAFRELLSGDLNTPIEHCPEWTLYDLADLADHVGNGNLLPATHPAIAWTGDRTALAGPLTP